MAEISDGGGGGKRAKKGIPKIDMTPMVDLGFLLLTFFVMTSTFQKSKVMKLTYPAKEVEDTKEQKINNALTFILTDEDRVFYYEGEFFGKGSAKPTQLEEASFDELSENSIRKLLIKSNKSLIREIQKVQMKAEREKWNDTLIKKEIGLLKKNKDLNPLNVLVKTDLKAKTKNFIDLIDECYINQIALMAPVDLMKDEQELIDAKLK
jgi:biopolymer transport protein ExbD